MIVHGGMEVGFQNFHSLALAAGVDLFEDRPFVITDRLHAHVLAVLLGIPNVAIDNSYGKISALYRSWTSRFGVAHFSDSVEEAVRIAESFTSRSQ